ncbi:U3 small nucleolar RNA-associated protein 25-like [Malania oleifera]|uniref:U3 small nucleolar RNA-associated protein 25-like n=1 Tax=Malania oleifera TaxID=397392 RepID=UPI0025ADAC54|nr:U3 small nucleolar RNA-associated protein 25-like [Malania oleifera]
MSFDNVGLVVVGSFRGDEARVGGRGRGAGGRARGSLADFSLKVPAFGARSHGGKGRKGRPRGKIRGAGGRRQAREKTGSGVQEGKADGEDGGGRWWEATAQVVETIPQSEMEEGEFAPEDPRPEVDILQMNTNQYEIV